MAIVKTDVYDVQAPFALDLRLVKADMNARNAIGTFQRYFGMVVYTLSDGKFWLWPQGAVDNDDWVDLFGNSDATIQSVVVNPGAPAGGSNGDIWLRQQGNVVSVYQNVEPAGWTPLGDLVIGSAPTYTPDPSLPDPPTKTYLNTNYPSAKVGDVVYWEGTTQVVEAKCYAAGEWNWITKNRCQ